MSINSAPFFNSTQWTVVIGLVALVATGWLYFEKRYPKLASDVPKGVKKVADGLAHFVEALAGTPWFAGKVAAGELEVRHITDKLLQSHLAQSAAQALASFGKSLSSLSESEKGTAVEMVQVAAQAVGHTVSATQALAILQDVDSAIQKLVGVAQAATERSQALKLATQQEASANA